MRGCVCVGANQKFVSLVCLSARTSNARGLSVSAREITHFHSPKPLATRAQHTPVTHARKTHKKHANLGQTMYTQMTSFCPKFVRARRSRADVTGLAHGMPSRRGPVHERRVVARLNAPLVVASELEFENVCAWESE